MEFDEDVFQGRNRKVFFSLTLSVKRVSTATKKVMKKRREEKEREREI